MLSNAVRGAKIRVLVVDDSVVIRRLVTQALSESADIEVAGSAANGRIALERIPQLSPDAITLDVEMPEMDGITTMKEIRKRHPGIRVIMFSTLTQRGAASTIDALASGADDYVTKASNAGSLDCSMTSLREELIPKIRQFFAPRTRPVIRPQGPAPGLPAAQTPAARTVARPRIPPKVIAIGVSTGGPMALARLAPMLPASFPAPVLIVQHMPRMFTRMLAERLQQQTKLQVREAAEGDEVSPGTILIAPGDYHMAVRSTAAGNCIEINQGPPENSCRPAADVLFRSVARVYGAASAAVILTGMGQDGLRGVEAMRAQGAAVIAQDEASSVVWGMPGAVVHAGLADRVVELDRIAQAIQELF